MNPKSLILLFLYLTPTLSLDPKFEACEPKTCGQGPNISYPFYIRGRQKAFCGNPGFDLTCGSDGYPILNLINTNYTVETIFYNNHSLRLSNPAFSSHGASCLARAQNLTAGKYRFRVAPAQGRVWVVYGCLGVQVGSRIGCDAGNDTASVLALEGGREELEMARGNCSGGLVEAAVEDGGGGAAAALRRGFLLIWNATNCTECVNSGGRCGFDLSTDIYAFRCYCPDRPHVVKCGTGTNGLSKIGKIGIGSSVGLLCILVIGWLLHHKRKHSSYGDQFQTKSTYSNPSSDPAVEGGSAYCGVHLFSYKELEEATNSFDLNKQIGDGGFGTVYYGKLKDGREVAVKHLYDHNYRRVEQFMNEVQILTRLRHRNLVSLYGCTSPQSRELLLVYDYIPNGTVASHLHGELSKPGLLTWPIRIKIAVETATALAYLHASNIIHRDVKTTNILLDNSFCVKVADFGLSRLFPNDITHVSTAPQGTPGYVDPEYHQCYHLTSKSDVYSFGVVLVELISSMQAVDVNRHKDEINLSNLAIKKIQKGALSELVDPFLGFDSENHEVKRMIVEVAGLAFQCLQQDTELRPYMDEVLVALKRIERGKEGPKHLEAADDVHGSEVSHSDVTELDEAGLLKNRKPPSSPISVTESWDSKSTTPNVSS